MKVPRMITRPATTNIREPIPPVCGVVAFLLTIYLPCDSSCSVALLSICSAVSVITLSYDYLATVNTSSFVFSLEKNISIMLNET